MRELRQHLVRWIRQKVDEAGARGTVVGLSGGVDSAVVAGLCREAVGDRALAVVMPIHSLPEDVDHALLVSEAFGIETIVLPLDRLHDCFIEGLPPGMRPRDSHSLAVANVKPRLRMAALYYYANALNYLVVGTSNRAELTVGYFTKFGDGAADILPLANLLKREVRDLAVEMGVPSAVIDKAPSAGLWEGQTDEAEMGLAYRDIDRYLATGEGESWVIAKIETLRARSQHKRERPPMAPVEEIRVTR